jgi:hypothetical protein
MWRIRSRGPQPYRNNSCDCDGYQAKPRCQFYPCLNGSAHLAGFAFSPTATTFKGSFSFVALRRIAVCVRLSFAAMVALSFEASIDDRSSSSSSGAHKILRGTIILPSPLTPVSTMRKRPQPWRTGAANPSRFPSGQIWGLGPEVGN